MGQEPRKDHAVVVVTDDRYWPRAVTTLRDVRGVGAWEGDLILITIPPFQFAHDPRLKELAVESATFPVIKEKFEFMKRVPAEGFAGSDRRELEKPNQWEKLHVFDAYFLSRWKYVLYLDAGLRIFHPIETSLFLEGYATPPFAIAIPRDKNPFSTGFVFDTVRELADFTEAFPETAKADMRQMPYALNCLWYMYTPTLVNLCGGHGLKQHMIECIARHRVWKHNEMSLMNAFFCGKWMPFPRSVPGTNLFTFIWNETDNLDPQTGQPFPYTRYAAIKYPTMVTAGAT
jgi:hypothetical protein